MAVPRLGLVVRVASDFIAVHRSAGPVVVAVLLVCYLCHGAMVAIFDRDNLRASVCSGVSVGKCRQKWMVETHA